MASELDAIRDRLIDAAKDIYHAETLKGHDEAEAELAAAIQAHDDWVREALIDAADEPTDERADAILKREAP